MMERTDLRGATPPQLLALYADILHELRQRAIIRSTNNPAADYAEYLVATALDLDLATNSTAGYDATDRMDGTRYQIKGRRPTMKNPSRQLGAIRNLPARHFDYLAGVLFAEDFSVARACLIPAAVVEREAIYIAHTNSWMLHLRDSLWRHKAVLDITPAVRAAAHPEVSQQIAGTVFSDKPQRHSDGEQSSTPILFIATDEQTPGIAAPQTIYEFSRFCFKADVIEPLAMHDSFRMVTKRHGTFQMTKRDFYRDFANVVSTDSYQRARLYHSPTVPKKALPYRIADVDSTGQ